MALLQSEVWRIKMELGYHLIDVAAEPYIGFVALFDQVIKPYLIAGATTQSFDPITGSRTTVQLLSTFGLGADLSGFEVGQQVVVDFAPFQERTVVRAVDTTLNTMSLVLTKDHGQSPDGFPITVESGETMVRNLINQLMVFDDPTSSAYTKMLSRAGIKALVGEVEFFGSGSGSFSALQQANELRDYLRGQLASIIGVHNLNPSSGGGACAMSSY